MSAPIVGVGYLTANNLLEDCAYSLIEPSVNTAIPVNIIAGTNVIAVWDRAIYVGALLVVGAYGDPNLEVVVVTAVVVGTSFTATFLNPHNAGTPVAGATFPVQSYLGDPFFTQEEMLGYLSQASNDFLTDVPLVMAVNDSITVPPTQQNTSLPADCMFPVRVATNNYPLRETSQSHLDQMDYRWSTEAPSRPRAYFRDKTGLQKVGIFPRQNNTCILEVIYAQRQTEVLGMADGFLIPDPFLIYVKYRVLSMAYGKDGEQRNPGLAKYWAGRYDMGVKISKMFLEAMSDPNLEMAQ